MNNATIQRIKPFAPGQRVMCSKATYAYPHEKRDHLIVENVRYIDNLAPHWRVKARLANNPYLYVDACADLFFT